MTHVRRWAPGLCLGAEIPVWCAPSRVTSVQTGSPRVMLDLFSRRSLLLSSRPCQPTCSVTYAIIGGNVNAAGTGPLLALNAASGIVTLPSLVNFEQLPNTFTVTFRLQDDGTRPPAPAHTDVAIAVTVLNCNDAPVMTSSPTFSVPENTPLGTMAYNLTVFDQDAGDTGGLAFSLSVHVGLLPFLRPRSFLCCGRLLGPLFSFCRCVAWKSPGICSFAAFVLAPR